MTAVSEQETGMKSLGFVGLAACLITQPAAAQPVPSTIIAQGVYDYRINGWQVRCRSSSRSMSLCSGRKSFGRIEVTIDASDDFLSIEVLAPCLALPEVYLSRSWDRRQPILTIEPARVLLTELNSRLRRCRRPALPDVTAYEMSDLMALFLAAVEAPAYVQ